MVTEIRKPERYEYQDIANLVNSAEEVFFSIRSPEMIDVFGTGKHTAEELEKGRERREHLVLTNQEKIVAFASYRFKNEQTMWISMLYVDPDEQRKGYGAMLLKHLEDIAKNKGILASVLETDEKAYWAVDFYKKHGYRILTAEDIKKFPFNKVLGKGPVKGRYLFGREL